MREKKKEVKGRREKKKNVRGKVIDLVRDCNGWENGKTSKEIANRIYGTIDQKTLRKTHAALRRAKEYFLFTQGKILHSRAMKVKKNGEEKREFRWFLVDSPEEAWQADTVLALRIDRNSRQLKLQMPLLDHLLTDSQRTELIKMLGSISVSLQLPPGESVEIK